MKTHPKKIEGNQAIEMLKQGYTIYEPKAHPSKLLFVEENKYKWSALNDEAPTFLTEAEVKDLIKNRLWLTDLL